MNNIERIRRVAERLGPLNDLVVFVGGSVVELLISDPASIPPRPTLFIASKIEAFKNRGKMDYLASPDFEDIISVVNGRSEIVTEIRNASEPVRSFIIHSFSDFLSVPDCLAAIIANIDGFENTGRSDVVLERLRVVSVQ